MKCIVLIWFNIFASLYVFWLFAFMNEKWKLRNSLTFVSNYVILVHFYSLYETWSYLQSTCMQILTTSSIYAFGSMMTVLTFGNMLSWWANISRTQMWTTQNMFTHSLLYLIHNLINIAMSSYEYNIN